MAELKTLIVCLSSDLPSENDRNPDCIYFVFNTLEIYIGKSLFGDVFAIVPTMPSSPDVDMLYICLDDGKVKVYDAYGVNEIALVQNQQMLDVLSQVGTSYFFNSKERYVDPGTRKFVLPFKNNDDFNMVVEFKEDTVINNDTIIKYNEKTGHFEISSDSNDTLKDLDIVGSETNSTIITVDNGRIRGDVKTSKTNGNLIKINSDGLYAIVRDKVTVQEYNSWKRAFSDYRVTIDASIDNIIDELTRLEDIVSEETIEELVHTKIEEIVPFIDEAIMRYSELAQKIDEILYEAMSYTDVEVEKARREIDIKIDKALMNPWGYLDGDSLSLEDFSRIALALKLFVDQEENNG